VSIAPVRFRPGHGLVAYRWEIDARLFDRRVSDVNFVVVTAPGPPSAVTAAEAVAAFGRPYQRYVDAGDVIMVWRKNLLGRLGSS
jgi:hypothetical protein